MMVRKKTLMIVAALLFFGFLAVSYAGWINCTGPFPGTCTQGGCLDPIFAEDCWLKQCMGNPTLQIQCDAPAKAV